MEVKRTVSDCGLIAVVDYGQDYDDRAAARVAVPEPFDAADIIAHAKCEGGEWVKGYVPDWVIAVHRDGRVFDRILERRLGRVLRGTFDAEQMCHIDNVVNGRFVPMIWENLSESDLGRQIDHVVGKRPMSDPNAQNKPPEAKPSWPSRASRNHQDWQR